MTILSNKRQFSTMKECPVSPNSERSLFFMFFQSTLVKQSSPTTRQLSILQLLSLKEVQFLKHLLLNSSRWRCLNREKSTSVISLQLSSGKMISVTFSLSLFNSLAQVTVSLQSTTALSLINCRNGWEAINERFNVIHYLYHREFQLMKRKKAFHNRNHHRWKEYLQ